jgi:Transmembrane protein 131-like N-terminal
VTSVGEGQADIIATYGPPAAGIRATIPVTVPPSRLSAVPRIMTFGSHAIGTTSTQPMTITNVSDDTMSITGVTVTGNYSETNNCVSSSPLPPGASCAIHVVFRPAAAGLSPGTVALKTTFHIFPVAFKLNGTGVGR